MTCMIQDDLVTALIDEYPDDLVLNGDGDLELEFSNLKEMESACEGAKASFKRGFDQEQHTCEICMLNLLGERFTFLTSCEHLFCTDCLKDMII